MEKTTAVLVETGINNSSQADITAYNALQSFFQATGVKKDGGFPFLTDFYHKGIQFKMKENVLVNWGKERNYKYNLTLREDLDTLNHKIVLAGRVFGWAESLEVFTTNVLSRNVQDYFTLRDGIIYLKQEVIPNFLNIEEKIMKRGGFYFFQKLNLDV